MDKLDLLFYEIMNYPIPKYWEYFSTKKINKKPEINKNEKSREKEDSLMQEYFKQINKHQKIFKNLPWIKKIYLCNSISFNKLNKWSDIDLFIIAKKWCLWRARFFSVLIFFFLWLKRTKSKISKRYCLSFYITQEAKNLYSINIENTDIYLAYRLAHLIPLYQEKTDKKTIYNYNSRLFAILPNLPKDKHIINIWLDIFTGNSKTKIYLEKYISWIIWQIVEYMIKTIRLPILVYKTKKLKWKWKNIIFNDNMLKFHQDKRKKISLLYRTKRNQSTSN